MLTPVADGVCSAEPHGVVERPVDRLGVVAPPVEPSEVGVGLRDLADVLGPVEPEGAVNASVLVTGMGRGICEAGTVR